MATDRNSTNKTKIAAKDAQMPAVGRLVFQILANAGTNARNLTQRQVDDILAVVICGSRTEPYSSRQAEYKAYPVAFETFCKTVHKATWFTKPKNHLSAGNVIKFLRGYDWYHGWFNYCPGGSEVQQVIENQPDDYLTRLNRGDFDDEG